jgi:hypothetical protein
MAPSVTRSLATRELVDRIDSLLRDAESEHERIGILGPDGQTMRLPGDAAGTCGARRKCTTTASRMTVAGWSRRPFNDVDDADARNLKVTAGAEEISSVDDGTMGTVVRPDKV